MSQSYQVLARKYRPSNFHELVGQTHVSKALINAIDHNRLHHAYLFTGTRGVGKTTIARILAKCLNCDTGITSTPCGVCDSCVAIEQGRFIDLIEIDAASRTKVEDTRELLDNVPYAPTQGRYKVYLIDEVHMLSTHSFNALLKTLEEPPAHVKFLLATTDPQKLPITIISRCLQFVLRPLAQEQLSEHLRNLLVKEEVTFEEPALWQLAHGAKGSVRDSLSLTDQAIAFGQGKLTEQTVNEMLGLINGADLASLIADIYHNDKLKVAQHIEQMREQMIDAGNVFDELADILHKIALVQVLPSIELNVSDAQAQAILRLAKHISAEVLQLYYDIVVKAREAIALATTPMQALEMCLLRMLAFRPLSASQVLVTDDSDDCNVDSLKIDSLKVESVEVDSFVSYQVVASSDETDTKTETETQLTDTQITQTNETADYTEKSVTAENSHAVDGQKNSMTEQTAQSTQLAAAEVASSTSLPQPESSVDEKPIVPVVIANDSQETNPQENNGSEVSHLETSHLAIGSPEITSHSSHPVVSEQSKTATEQVVIEESKLEKKTDIDSSNISVKADDNAQESITQVQTADVQVDVDVSSNVSVDVDDPRVLLRCPEQSLDGEWSYEKWDYWIQQSRDKEFLDSAELGFARQGLMTGTIEGESVFITNFSGDNFQRLFDSIEAKLRTQFINATYEVQTLTETDTDTDKNLLANIPQKMQFNRVQQAKAVAKNKLKQSAVMQYLNQQELVTINTVNLTL